MQNNLLHKKKLTQISKVNLKTVVDINIILNRVKVEKKNETKRKVIFFSVITLALTLFGTFIATIK
tara:strand:- start:138 stop:335 length:198 start_codon:yes stop_codon:yes gene_type:complete